MFDCFSSADSLVDDLGQLMDFCGESCVLLQRFGQLDLHRADLFVLGADASQSYLKIAFRAIRGSPNQEPDVKLGDGGHKVQGEVESRAGEPRREESAVRIDHVKRKDQRPADHDDYPNADVERRPHAV